MSHRKMWEMYDRVQHHLLKLGASFKLRARFLTAFIDAQHRLGLYPERKS